MCGGKHTIACGTRRKQEAYRHDANLRLPRLDDARAVGSDEARLALLTEHLLHLHHAAQQGPGGEGSGFLR